MPRQKTRFTVEGLSLTLLSAGKSWPGWQLSAGLGSSGFEKFLICWSVCRTFRQALIVASALCSTRIVILRCLSLLSVDKFRNIIFLSKCHLLCLFAFTGILAEPAAEAIIAALSSALAGVSCKPLCLRVVFRCWQNYFSHLVSIVKLECVFLLITANAQT